MLFSTVSRPQNRDGEIFITLYPGERPRPFKGIIKVFVDNSEIPEVSIPVKGPDSLEIKRAISPCGCTVIRITKKNLAPHDTGSIIVSFTTTMIEGTFEREFSLLTNSKLTRNIGLKIKGNNQRFTWFSPPVIDLDQFQQGSKDTFNVKITWKRWEPPGFKSPEGIPFFQYGKIAQGKDDTTIWHVPIILSPKVEADYYNDTLIVNTSSVSWPKVSIPVQGRIKPFATCKPEFISLGSIKKGKRVTTSTLLITSAPIDTLVSCETTEDNIKIGTTKFLSSKKMRIYIHSVKNPEKTVINGEIQVKIICRGRTIKARAYISGRYVE